MFSVETALNMAQISQELCKSEPNSFAYKTQKDCFEQLVKQPQKDSSDRPDGGPPAQSQQDYLGIR